MRLLAVQVMRRHAEFGPRLFQGWMLARSTQLVRHLCDLQREALSFCRLAAKLEAALEAAMPAAAAAGERSLPCWASLGVVDPSRAAHAILEPGWTA